MLFVRINSVIFFAGVINVFNEIASLEAASTKTYNNECNKSRGKIGGIRNAQLRHAIHQAC